MKYRSQVAKIKHCHLNSNNKCLIQLLSCKVCGLQYLGFTTDTFCFLWNNYKKNDRKTLREQEHMQLELFEYFSTDNHICFLNDCSITKQMVLIPKKEKSNGERF